MVKVPNPVLGVEPGQPYPHYLFYVNYDGLNCYFSSDGGDGDSYVRLTGSPSDGLSVSTLRGTDALVPERGYYRRGYEHIVK